MQETRNNCFGLKKCNTTLPQAKTGKHECRNVAATHIAVTCNCTRAATCTMLLHVAALVCSFFTDLFSLLDAMPSTEKFRN